MIYCNDPNIVVRRGKTINCDCGVKKQNKQTTFFESHAYQFVIGILPEYPWGPVAPAQVISSSRQLSYCDVFALKVMAACQCPQFRTKVFWSGRFYKMQLCLKHPVRCRWVTARTPLFLSFVCLARRSKTQGWDRNHHPRKLPLPALESSVEFLMETNRLHCIDDRLKIDPGSWGSACLSWVCVDKELFDGDTH